MNPHQFRSARIPSSGHGVSTKRLRKNAATRLDELIRIQGNRCFWCTRPMGKRGSRDDDAPSVEHLVPISNGGGNHPDNLKAVHQRCNR